MTIGTNPKLKQLVKTKKKRYETPINKKQKVDILFLTLKVSSWIKLGIFHQLKHCSLKAKLISLFVQWFLLDIYEKW